ncbi:MAG: ZIP family metal transporter [Minisyncoccia bacterium]
MFEALIGALCISLLSLIGVFFFGNSGKLTGTHRFILPVAVGVFLGIVFFDLIPETLEVSPEWGPIAIMLGFLGFYLLSHFLDTFHHHHFDEHDACVRNGAQKLLIGDSIHNFADGVVLASAFMISPFVGIFTTIGIALHEIPQEIAEFGVLLQSGYTKRTAAFYNFLSSLTVILGVLITYAFAQSLEGYLFILTGVAAGNLLYIAATDLLPELRHSHHDHFFKTFTATLLGIIAVAILTSFTH